MDFVRAIQFPFEDRDWPTKVVVGTLLSLLPFMGQGYQITVARNVIRGKEDPLPGTENLGQVAADGVMATIAALVYMLPLLPFMCVMGAMMGATGDSDVGGLMAMCLSLCVLGAGLIYAVPAWTLYHMGIIHYSETGNFVEFLRIGALWHDVRDNLGTMLMLWVYLIVLVLAVLALSAVLWITCVGLPLMGFCSLVVSGHLIGQTGLEIRGEGASRYA
jgi:hypothetical protein